MTDAPPPPPPRERITRPGQTSPRHRPVEVTREIDEQTVVGEVFMRSLMRTQLRLAGLVVLVLVVTLGMLPLLFAFVPQVAHAHVAGIPLPWLLLGFLVYPALVALGWFYVRQAERNEDDFADLVHRR
ncbi:MAG: DUF485 domain-containing protein [Nocardioidaceae bacterium]